MAEKERKKGRIRRVLRIAIPVVMVGFGIATVAYKGWEGLIALIPILAAHVAVALVVIPLWVRYQRRRRETAGGDGD
jgi:hypothetical protein